MKKPTMTSEQDGEIAERHRAASALLDERPADFVRTTVLAAAARAVDARPGGVARPRTRWKDDALRRYQPLSAAALLVVSVLTGLVAMQAYLERPDLIVAEQVASRPASASTETPPASTPTPASPAPSDAATVDQARAQSAAATAPATAPFQGMTPRAPNKKTAAAPVPQVGEPAPALRRDAAPIASPKSERAQAPDQEAFASAAREQALPPGTRDRTSSSQTDASNGASNAPAAVGSMREKAGVAQQPAPALKMNRGAAASLAPAPQDVEPATPELWVARVVRLREEHRDEEADRELARLRERFPAYVVPDRALRKADTHR